MLLHIIPLPTCAHDGPVTLQRHHVPAVPSLVDTCHRTQGEDYKKGVALYIDNTPNAVWCRQMWFMTLCRAVHMWHIYLLTFSESTLKSMLMTPLPKLAIIDEWVHNNDALTTSFQPFVRRRVLYKHIPIHMYPTCKHVCYCIANATGHTYIGFSGDFTQRVHTHNTPSLNRPAIMDYIPSGWVLMVWVGPFGTKDIAEAFERNWQQTGKKGHVRHLSYHIAGAFSLADRFDVKVHYCQCASL